MTEEIFRCDSYAKECDAEVLEFSEDGIVLNRTVFYPRGGGQPGDTGIICDHQDNEIVVTDTIKNSQNGKIYHIPARRLEPLTIGTRVSVKINWDRRYCLMRMHSALHLLSSIVGGRVTGGQVGIDKSRLDFDLTKTELDKKFIERSLNEMIAADYPFSITWISEEEIADNENLVRTMAVKPPTGIGKVRLIGVEGVDLQACGGTHVSRSSEIGGLRVGKIENKGRHNRRVNLHLVKNRVG